MVLLSMEYVEIDGAHSFEHYNSQQILETRGQVALRTDRPGAITDVLKKLVLGIADRLPVYLELSR